MKSKFLEWSYTDPKTSSLLSFYCSQYGATVTMRHENDEVMCRISTNLKRKDMKELRDFLTKVLDMDLGYKRNITLNRGDYEDLVKMVKDYGETE